MDPSYAPTYADVESWGTAFGLLPVPLHPGLSSPLKYVLLNGSRGNFCLDLAGSPTSNLTRSIAWSANVGHYVSLLGDSIELQRWDASPASVERYTASSVFRDPEAFHRHLDDTSPKSHLSVVSHCLRVFRRLRALLGSQVDGAQALSAFLYLLADVASHQGTADSARSLKAPNDSSRQVASAIRPADWIALATELETGPKGQALKADIPLILSHAAGDLFQEAHFEAVTIPQDQLTLEGILPQPAALAGSPKIKGIHFTPPALARALVEEALALADLSKKDITVFDPACGSGEFLREAFRLLRLLGYTGEINLIGWDISPAACEIASFSLAFETATSVYPKAITVEHRNSLLDHKEWPPSPEIILTNPPFISWQDMSGDERDFIRESIPPLATGRPDAAYAFLWLAARALAEGGTLASVIPASFLDSDSASKLRSAMRESLSPSLLARLGSHAIFARSVIDTGLFVATKGPKHDTAPTALWADYRSSSTSAALRALRKGRTQHTQAPIVGDGFSIYHNSWFGQQSSSWAPRPYTSWIRAQRITFSTTVGALFAVKQGVRTGATDVFIITPQQFDSLPRREKTYFRPSITNRSIRNGFLRLTDYVFYPYGTAPITDETQLSAAVPTYYHSHLLPHKEELISRSRISADRWWELSEYRAWQVSPLPKIVSTYFGDIGSFAWDDSGQFVVVQGFGWIPRHSWASQPLPPSVGKAYLALLSSDFFSSLLSAHSNHVAGGQWNLSRKFVDAIPLPDLLDPDISPDTIAALARLGDKIHRGMPIDPQVLNEAVDAIYSSAGQPVDPSYS